MIQYFQWIYILYKQKKYHVQNIYFEITKNIICNILTHCLKLLNIRIYSSYFYFICHNLRVNSIFNLYEKLIMILNFCYI